MFSSSVNQLVDQILHQQLITSPLMIMGAHVGQKGSQYARQVTSDLLPSAFVFGYVVFQISDVGGKFGLFEVRAHATLGHLTSNRVAHVKIAGETFSYRRIDRMDFHLFHHSEPLALPVESLADRKSIRQSTRMSKVTVLAKAESCCCQMPQVTESEFLQHLNNRRGQLLFRRRSKRGCTGLFLFSNTSTMSLIGSKRLSGVG